MFIPPGYGRRDDCNSLIVTDPHQLAGVILHRAQMWGGLAVLLSGLAPKYIFCPAWLCGWSIGLTVLSPSWGGGNGHPPLGDWGGYTGRCLVCRRGAFVDVIQKKLARFLAQKFERGE